VLAIFAAPLYFLVQLLRLPLVLQLWLRLPRFVNPSLRQPLVLLVLLLLEPPSLLFLFRE
jgi:hypothetical protein